MSIDAGGGSLQKNSRFGWEISSEKKREGGRQASREGGRQRGRQGESREAGRQGSRQGGRDRESERKSFRVKFVMIGNIFSGTAYLTLTLPDR